jgi:hypothetical protein
MSERKFSDNLGDHLIDLDREKEKIRQAIECKNGLVKTLNEIKDELIAKKTRELTSDIFKHNEVERFLSDLEKIEIGIVNPRDEEHYRELEEKLYDTKRKVDRKIRTTQRQVPIDSFSSKVKMGLAATLIAGSALVGGYLVYPRYNDINKAPLEAQISALELENRTNLAKIGKLNREIKETNEEHQRFRESLRGEEATIADLREILRVANGLNQDYEAERVEVETLKDELTTHLRDYESEKARADQLSRRIETERAEGNQITEGLREELAELKTKENALKQTASVFSKFIIDKYESQYEASTGTEVEIDEDTTENYILAAKIVDLVLAENAEKQREVGEAAEEERPRVSSDHNRNNIPEGFYSLDEIWTVFHHEDSLGNLLETEELKWQAEETLEELVTTIQIDDDLELTDAERRFPRNLIYVKKIVPKDKEIPGFHVKIIRDGEQLGPDRAHAIGREHRGVALFPLMDYLSKKKELINGIQNIPREFEDEEARAAYLGSLSIEELFELRYPQLETPHHQAENLKIKVLEKVDYSLKKLYTSIVENLDFNFPELDVKYNPEDDLQTLETKAARILIKSQQNAESDVASAKLFDNIASNIKAKEYYTARRMYNGEYVIDPLKVDDFSETLFTKIEALSEEYRDALISTLDFHTKLQVEVEEIYKYVTGLDTAVDNDTISNSTKLNKILDFLSSPEVYLKNPNSTISQEEMEAVRNNYYGIFTNSEPQVGDPKPRETKSYGYFISPKIASVHDTLLPSQDPIVLRDSMGRVRSYKEHDQAKIIRSIKSAMENHNQRVETKKQTLKDLMNNSLEIDAEIINHHLTFDGYFFKLKDAVKELSRREGVLTIDSHDDEVILMEGVSISEALMNEIRKEYDWRSRDPDEIRRRELGVIKEIVPPKHIFVSNGDFFYIWENGDYSINGGAPYIPGSPISEVRSDRNNIYVSFENGNQIIFHDIPTEEMIEREKKVFDLSGRGLSLEKRARLLFGPLGTTDEDIEPIRPIMASLRENFQLQVLAGMDGRILFIDKDSFPNEISSRAASPEYRLMDQTNLGIRLLCRFRDKHNFFLEYAPENYGKIKNTFSGISRTEYGVKPFGCGVVLKTIHSSTSRENNHMLRTGIEYRLNFNELEFHDAQNQLLFSGDGQIHSLVLFGRFTPLIEGNSVIGMQGGLGLTFGKMKYQGKDANGSMKTLKTGNNIGLTAYFNLSVGF